MVGKTKAFYTKNDMLYSLLKDNLLSGAYHPGERLVVADLAAEFQVTTQLLHQSAGEEQSAVVSFTHIPRNSARRSAPPALWRCGS